MNKDNAKEYLPLVQALADGETIQRNAMITKPRWMNMEDVDFNLTPDRYRVKPKPREVWLNEYSHGFAGRFETKMDADACAMIDRIKAVRFIEAIE